MLSDMTRLCREADVKLPTGKLEGENKVIPDMLVNSANNPFCLNSATKEA